MILAQIQDIAVWASKMKGMMIRSRSLSADSWLASFEKTTKC